MTEKDRLLNLTAALIFHAEQMVECYRKAHHGSDSCIQKEFKEHREKFRFYSIEIEEGITWLKRNGEL